MLRFRLRLSRQLFQHGRSFHLTLTSPDLPGAQCSEGGQKRCGEEKSQEKVVENGNLQAARAVARAPMNSSIGERQPTLR